MDPFRMMVKRGGRSVLLDCGLEAKDLAGYEGDGIIDMWLDVVLQWLGGGPQLAITVENEDDTLLVIRDPEGGWHFDDNGRGHNPLAVFDDAEIGEYVIFIGTHGTNALVRPGDLITTETGP